MKRKGEEINKLQSKHERIETIDMLLKDTEREAAQLAAALAKVSRGIVGKTLEAKVNEVERRYTALSQERDELQASLTAQTFTDESIQETMRFREEVLVGMRKPTFEDKRHILEMLRVEVTVTDGQAWAKCVVPIGTRVFNLHTSRSAFPIPARTFGRRRHVDDR